MDKQHPNNHKLELTVLHGLITQDPKEQKYTLNDMSESLFFNSDTNKLFKAIKKMIDETGQATADSLHGKVAPKILTDLVMSSGLTLDINYDIKTLKEYDYKRKAINMTSEVAKIAYDQETSIEDVEKAINIESAKVVNSHTKIIEVTTMDMIKEATREIQEANTRGLTEVAIQYHTPFIDDVLVMHRGWFHYTGGYQGTGKTALWLGAAKNQILAGRKILYFCVESSGKELFKRMMSESMDTEVNDLLLGNPDRMNAPFMKKLGVTVKDFVDRADSFKIYGPGDFTKTIQGVAKEAHKWAREYGNPDMIYLDFIQNLNSIDPKKDTNGKIAEAANGFQDLINELNCAGTVLGQLNKASASVGSPTMQSFRGDSTPLDIAHVISCLYRGDPNKLEIKDDMIKTTFYSLKTRLLPPFRTDLAFQGRTCSFKGRMISHTYGEEYRPKPIEYYNDK